MTGWRTPALALGLSIGAAGHVWAQAQTLPPPPSSTPPTTGAPPVSTTPQGQAVAEPPSSSQVEEIVVTAQKRSENLQNVPIAITAITADKLASANISSTASLRAVTPAITFSDVNGFLEPRIRGIGSSSAGAAAENSVVIAALSGAPNTNNRNAAGVPIVLFHDPHDTYANNDASHKLLTGGVTLRIDQKVGDYTLLSITAGRRSSFGQAFDADAGPQPTICKTLEQLDQ